MMKKIMNKILDYLPVSKKEMKKVLGNMILVMDGYATVAMSQQQTTNGILRELERMKTTNPDGSQTEKKGLENDPAFN